MGKSGGAAALKKPAAALAKTGSLVLRAHVARVDGWVVLGRAVTLALCESLPDLPAARICDSLCTVGRWQRGQLQYSGGWQIEGESEWPGVARVQVLFAL
eukprot:2023420-Alexandrium_andersonii.AAC.1